MKAKLPPPMSGWQEMTGMGWTDIDMKVRRRMVVMRMIMMMPKSPSQKSRRPGALG